MSSNYNIPISNSNGSLNRIGSYKTYDPSRQSSTAVSDGYDVSQEVRRSISDDPSKLLGNRWPQSGYPGTYPGGRQNVTVKKVEYSSSRDQGQGFRHVQSPGELSSQPVYQDEMVRAQSEMTVNQRPTVKINPHFSVSITPSPSSFSSVVTTKMKSPPPSEDLGRLNPGFRVDADPRGIGISREATNRGFSLVSGAPITVQHISSTSINTNGSFPDRRPFDRLPESAPRRIIYSSQSGEKGIAMSRPFVNDLPSNPNLHLGDFPPRATRAYSESFGSDSLSPTDDRGSHSSPFMVRSHSAGADSLQFGLRRAPPGSSLTGSLLASLHLGQQKSGRVQSLKSDGAQGSAESPTGRKHEIEAEVDALTDILMENMSVAGNQDFYGMCSKCGRGIIGQDAGCTAIGRLYHTRCFHCSTCGGFLNERAFYAMESKPYCEKCYMASLEKCSVCAEPITDRMLRATGRPFHPACFSCVVCHKSLDGVAFTIDSNSQIHCLEDFHRRFAPRCCVCSQPIMPNAGHEEAVRIVALDRSFHVGCYRCEDCGLVLSSEAEGRGCYPLNEHLLCKRCNAKHTQGRDSEGICRPLILQH